MNFPVTRMRRLRYNGVLRQMVTETKLSVDDFVMPLFVIAGTNVRNEIKSMPGNYQLSVENIVEECKKVYASGVKAVLLFGIPAQKEEDGTELLVPGIVPKLSRTPGKVHRTAPDIGQDNEKVLKELGLTDDQIAAAAARILS